jgi:hypothetical protein
MVSELAKGDWEDLKAKGYNPTLEDFDRLNQIALRLKDGAETTCANFPRIGWAGDVPFYEPTFAAFAWYHEYAMRTAANEETELTLWAFALAHARDPHFFDSLVTAEQIDKAVSAWAKSLPVTRNEILRACRFAATGFDDAQPAKPDSEEAQPAKPDNGDARSATALHRASVSAAAANLVALEKKLAEACVSMHVAPDALRGETFSRINRICEAAAVELGRKMTKDESRLQADYDLTFREIFRRLKAEKEAADGKAHG